ncbi:hypothetical protein COLO4_07902 [Corchorus olitorius]|uniref:Uncharacterized protein n=1 Tax=Corchorus olitorius TaxID=93759 RepID=A0A1R3KIC8_9ROSI|nr:hypothetical protein COLO4_07902 [Corchorus olitorius]
MFLDLLGFTLGNLLKDKRVKSVDLHPTEPWILASLYSGTMCIWNYQSQHEKGSKLELEDITRGVEVTNVCADIASLVTLPVLIFVTMTLVKMLMAYFYLLDEADKR